MHARPIRSSLGPDPNESAPVCTGPKSLYYFVEVLALVVCCFVLFFFALIPFFDSYIPIRLIDYTVY